MESADGVESLVVCCGFAHGGLAVVSLEEKVGMLVDASVIEVGLSRAADIINDVFEEV